MRDYKATLTRLACLAMSLQLAFCQSWTQVWSDEFTFVPTTKCNRRSNCTNNGINLNTWSFELGDGQDYGPGMQGWGNQEQQCYTASGSNARITGKGGKSRDGYLTIQALYFSRPIACANRKGPTNRTSWTSARLVTRGTRAFSWAPPNFPVDGTRRNSDLQTPLISDPAQATPIKVEALVKLPLANGSWPALWMLPDPTGTRFQGQSCMGCGRYGSGWCINGELDLMEHQGLESKVCSNLFYGGWRSQPWNGCTSYWADPCPALGPTALSGWINVTAVWTPTNITTFINGIPSKVFRSSEWWSGGVEKFVNPYAPYDQPFYFVANMAVGGAYVRDRPDMSKPWIFMVDYIRVFAQRPQPVNGRA